MLLNWLSEAVSPDWKAIDANHLFRVSNPPMKGYKGGFVNYSGEGNP